VTVFRAVCLYADDGLVHVADLMLILTVDCGEDVRVVGDEPEVEVANVIGFEVVPSPETVQKDRKLLDNQPDDRQ
jgi:hypothetical protein